MGVLPSLCNPQTWGTGEKGGGRKLLAFECHGASGTVGREQLPPGDMWWGGCSQECEGTQASGEPGSWGTHTEGLCTLNLRVILGLPFVRSSPRSCLQAGLRVLHSQRGRVEERLGWVQASASNSDRGNRGRSHSKQETSHLIL